MIREEVKYLVLKWEDIDNSLSDSEISMLIAMTDVIAADRRAMNKEPNSEYVVVSKKWPMYEQVWKLVEDWVDSK